ncbi:uncharacterized protein LOC131847895 [Achroia grisella]|uniref:uncharacterized protein LOC131847895 n=1 Tax=Achroia grisella TaxID=688607 RepID=UPI0027D29D76|nr:uncharacterized protein LOC131847895 [Achroia grisella]
MSYPPPSGPPPPYSPYTGQPAYTTYAYAPTPVYMPVYPPHVAAVPQPQQPPNSTYVTNVYQQPTPEPVRVVEHTGSIEWIPASTTSFQHLRALEVGRYWIIRAHHDRELIPGKLHPGNKAANVPYGGREVPVYNFEVLCAKVSDVRWLPCSGGKVPPGAIAAGHSQNGEQLYVAKANHRLNVIPGKVHPSHKCCYISYMGSEIACQSYEVLCKMYD